MAPLYTLGGSWVRRQEGGHEMIKFLATASNRRGMEMTPEAEFRLIVIRVFVTDWERALHFYEHTVGIPVATRAPELHWAELDTGAAHVAIERFVPEPGHESLVGRFLGVSLAVSDVYAVHERLVARGVEFVEPPEPMPWGGVLAHFRDPDGNALTLVGPPRAG
jgi:lactoylglutathione lyase